MIRIVLVTAGVMMMTTGAFAGNCSRSSAGGIGVSQDIASFMSNKALHNMLVKNGERGVGKVTTTCKPGVVWDCISAQKSCK